MFTFENILQPWIKKSLLECLNSEGKNHILLSGLALRADVYVRRGRYDEELEVEKLRRWVQGEWRNVGKD